MASRSAPAAATVPRTGGEQWVSEQLALLRGDRFALRAVGRFLASSSARAATIRAQRPETVRRGRRWLALGAAAWIVPAAFGLEPWRRRLGVGLVWWAGTAAMLEWHLGMFETEDGRPRNLGPADALTLTRAWLVPVVASMPTPLLCAVGMATDVLDGPLARRLEPTRAGRDLEGLVDACFSLAALRGLARERLLGRGSALAEAGRLVAGTGAATLVYFGRAEAPDARLVHAARSASVVRGAGILVAAAGRRRLGDALVVSGCIASAALSARALRRS